MTCARDRWLVLAAALLGWSFDGFEMGVVPLIARPALVELLGNNTSEELVRQWNGTLSIAFLLGAAAGGVIFGWLGDRIGRVRAMAISVLVYAGLTGLSALASSPLQLTVLRFFAAFGMGGEWALGVALVVETWPEKARPWLAGLIGVAVNVGYVGVAVIRLIGPEIHWRTMFALCALPALLTFFLRMYVPESKRWQASVTIETRPRVGELFSTGLLYRTISGAAAAAILIVAVWGAIQLTQLWADRLAGSRAAAMVQMVSASAAAVGAMLAPMLLATMSRRVGYFLLSATALASAQYLFLAHNEFGTQFLVAVGIAGVFTGAFNGWLPLYLPELFPTRLRATGQGTCYNAGRILAALAVWTSVGTVDLNGSYANTGALVAGIYAVGMALAWVLPETSGRLHD